MSDQHPHVTVAAVTQRAGRFLLVEERVDGRLVVNQPAGHWEPGESLVDAVIRETMEETGWSFVPEYLLGIYMWATPKGDTYLRFAFGGRVDDPGNLEIEPDIVRVLWWDIERVRAEYARLRSPMVLRCMGDCLDGLKYPLACINSMLPGTPTSN